MPSAVVVVDKSHETCHQNVVVVVCNKRRVERGGNDRLLPQQKGLGQFLQKTVTVGVADRADGSDDDISHLDKEVLLCGRKIQNGLLLEEHQGIYQRNALGVAYLVTKFRADGNDGAVEICRHAENGGVRSRYDGKLCAGSQFTGVVVDPNDGTAAVAQAESDVVTYYLGDTFPVLAVVVFKGYEYLFAVEKLLFEVGGICGVGLHGWSVIGWEGQTIRSL